MSSSPSRRVLSAVSWSVLGTGSAQAILLVASVIVARLLGGEDFGRFSIVQFTINLVYVIISSSIGWAVMRTVASLRTVDCRRLGIELSTLMAIGSTVSVLLSLLALFSSNFIANNIFLDIKLSSPLVLSSICILFGSVYAIFLSGLSGFEAFRSMALLNIGRSVLLGFGIVIGAFWGRLEGAVWAMGISHFIITWLAYQQLRQTLQKHSVRLTQPDWLLGLKLTLNFSLPTFLSSLFSSMMPWLGNVFLARSVSSFSEIAVINVANHWRTLVMFLPTQISQSTAPVLSNLLACQDHAQFWRIALSNIRNIFIIMLISILPSILLADWVLNLYGLSVPQQGFAFQLLMISTLFTALCAALGYILVAMGRFWAGLTANTVWSILFLMSAWLTIVQMNMRIVGLGWTYLVSYIALFFVLIILIRQGVRRSQQVAVGR